MKILIQNLRWEALDYAVAVVLGYHVREDSGLWMLSTNPDDWRTVFAELRGYEPSNDWKVGGPIVYSRNICLMPPIVRRVSPERHAFPVNYWRAMIQADEDENAFHMRGPNPLVAAMRVLVSSHTEGDSVEIPDNLLRDFQINQVDLKP